MSPKLPWVSPKLSRMSGPDREMKKVWPKEDRRVSAKPRPMTRQCCLTSSWNCIGHGRVKDQDVCDYAALLHVVEGEMSMAGLSLLLSFRLRRPQGNDPSALAGSHSH